MQPKLDRREWTVLAFTLLYMLAWLVAAWMLNSGEFLFYLAVMCVLLAAVAAVHFAIRFHLAALWGLSLWGLAHMAGGLLPIPSSWPRGGESPVLYNLWLLPGLLKYDQLVHAYGFALVTWILWQALARMLSVRGIPVRPSVGLLSICAAGGMGFGAANEVVEFIATLLLPGTNVGGYQNTGWDLVANSAGALGAAVAIWVWGRVGGPGD